MSDTAVKYDVELNVVERLSHLDKSLMHVFSCAVEGGTYFFNSINLSVTMGSEPPTLELDKSAGSILLERDGSILWKSGHIINRGGGMGNEDKQYVTEVPEYLMPQYDWVDNTGAKGNAMELQASRFLIGDIVRLKGDDRFHPHSSAGEGEPLRVDNQLKRCWDRQQQMLNYYMDEASAVKSVEHEREFLEENKEFTPRPERLNVESVRAQHMRRANEMLDKICFVPSGMA